MLEKGKQAFLPKSNLSPIFSSPSLLQNWGGVNYYDRIIRTIAIKAKDRMGIEIRAIIMPS